MKIAFNGAFWGMQTTGSGQYTRHLWRALAQAASSEERILILPSFSEQAHAEEPITGGIHRLGTPLDRLGENWAKLWFEQVAFPQACRRLGADVAHVPYFAPPLRPTAPTVVTIHDLIPLILPQYRGPAGVRAYMRLVSMAAHKANLILTDSRASARDIESRLGIPSARIRIIYLAADTIYRPLSPAEREGVLERLGIPRRYILYLGGFDRRKNVPELLQAFARAQNSLDEAALVIAGKLPRQDSDFMPDPKRIAAELGIVDRVHFTGWVNEEDKPALYAGALAFVFPSAYEGFGLPVLEAISCGTPAIVAGGSSLEEIVGQGGLVVPAGDVGALARAMVDIARQPELRQQLSLKAIEHAQSFSWLKTARQTLEAYREALGK